MSALSGGEATRLLVVWCPDWPVTAASVAAGIPLHHPAAVFSANRVVACSATARSNGVRRGMRRREAQSCCPGLAVLGMDSSRDARLFEPVAAAVEELVVGVEVVRSGVVAVPAMGAVSYFGGEHELIERVVDHVSGSTGLECQVGIADGLFTAVLTARRGVVVEPGAAARFLEPLPITELVSALPTEDNGELVDLLRRLGLRTLGQFAELSERTVSSRFGRVGMIAHRLARGLSERPIDRRRPPEELAVVETFDPPLDRVDAAAFVAKTLAKTLHTELGTRDLACTRLSIYAVTATGEELARTWRCAEPVSEGGIADRVRWQFDSWLRVAPADGPESRPNSGVVKLRLQPEELVDASMLQLGLWRSVGGDDDTDERAGRALVRVQGLLGQTAVCTPVLTGGRGPGERVRLVPWGDPRDDADERPWPGRLPAPSPATVFTERIEVTVTDDRGRSVAVTERGQLTSPPRQIEVAGHPARHVLGWAGPWPVDERWWDPHDDGMRARVQIVVDKGDALLLRFRAHARPRWIVEGEYS
ncbi:DNA polymerase Y family protein [Haloechinothrix salitolerans]|uniref:DNA polymerase Y family protein n=1 Tax=Haloechinothrix salitolerans TaxID=926830 RepID=A0ABW2C891_9PSEU